MQSYHLAVLLAATMQRRTLRSKGSRLETPALDQQAQMFACAVTEVAECLTIALHCDVASSRGLREWGITEPTASVGPLIAKLFISQDELMRYPSDGRQIDLSPSRFAIRACLLRLD